MRVVGSRIDDKQIAGEIGKLHVFGELLKRGVVPYVPLVGQGLNALVRVPGCAAIEIQIRTAGSAGGKHPRWFQVDRIEPRKNFVVVGVEFNDGKPKHVWIFPSIIFDKYANRPPKGTPRDLDLDSGIRKYGIRLRDLLCGFRDRWELILDYERYEALMETPDDLEDLLTMYEAEEAPEEEALSLEEYDRRRSAALSNFRPGRSHWIEGSGRVAKAATGE